MTKLLNINVQENIVPLPRHVSIHRACPSTDLLLVSATSQRLLYA